MAAAPPKMITKAELAKHNTDKDCWVAIHGLVINVDKKLQAEHPGGPEVIYAVAGKDVTEDFEDIGHSDAAREWCDKLILGYLEGHEPADKSKPLTMKRNADLLSSNQGGGGMGVVYVVMAVAVALGAYFYMYGGAAES